MFAALLAAMPESESSTTRHSLGARPSFSAEADVGMWCAGFDFVADDDVEERGELMSI